MADDSDNSAQVGGEIRMPKLVIPLGVDPGELEVYLETLKNSSMVKGSTPDESEPLKTQPVRDAAVAGSDSVTGSGANLEALVAGVRVDMADVLREMQGIRGILEVIMGNVLNG